MSKRKSARTKPGAGNVPDFMAVLSWQQIQDMDRAESGAGSLAVQRRMTLAVLTRSAAELLDAWANPAGQEAMFAAIEIATSWQRHLKASCDMADAAIARLILTAKAIAEPEAQQ